MKKTQCPNCEHVFNPQFVQKNRIIELIKINGELTTKELAELMIVNPSHIQYLCSLLFHAGKIDRKKLTFIKNGQEYLTRDYVYYFQEKENDNQD